MADIVCPLPLMKAGTEVVIGPHGGSELYLQAKCGLLRVTPL